MLLDIVSLVCMENAKRFVLAMMFNIFQQCYIAHLRESNVKNAIYLNDRLSVSLETVTKNMKTKQKSRLVVFKSVRVRSATLKFSHAVTI